MSGKGSSGVRRLGGAAHSMVQFSRFKYSSVTTVIENVPTYPELDKPSTHD